MSRFLTRTTLSVILTLMINPTFAGADSPSSATANATTPTANSWPEVTLDNTRQFIIDSRQTGRSYRILVAVPDSPVPEGGFPVVYSLDGNTTFPLWKVMAERLQQRGQARGALVVGITAAEGDKAQLVARAEDYTPPAANMDKTGDQSGSRQGGADRFLAFIEQELKPQIEQHFAINRHQQTLFGHSYGGLFTLHTLFTHPESFQRYVAASPSIWWNERYVLSERNGFADRLAALAQPVTLMLTVGSEEQTAPASMKAERVQMLQKRAQVDNVKQLFSDLQQAEAAESDGKLQLGLHIFPGENHMSAMPEAINRAVEFVYGGKP